MKETISKICRKCKINKSRKDFTLCKRSSDLLQSYCKECSKISTRECRKRDPFFGRKWELKFHYDMTLKEYNDLFKKQDEKCLICKLPESRINKNTGRIKYLAVDHDHKTGKIRGLLCQSCNLILGYAKDNIEILKEAICYLKERNNE